MRGRSLRASLTVTVVVAAALAAATSSAAPPAIDAKRAEAQQVLAQIEAMDAELDVAVEAYNGASVRLGQVERELASARAHLSLATKANREAQRRLAERIVALYMNGADASVLEIVLGSSNLNEALDRLDAAKRISDQDAQIVEELRVTQETMRRERRRLDRAVGVQRRLVAERAAKRQEIEQRISERQAYYSSVKSQITDLVAEEKARQERLAQEARRREEERLGLAAAAEAAGVQVSTPAPQADTVPEYSTPTGIGTAPGSRLGEQAVAIALQYLGVPYVWGGASPSTGFDCSGLTMYVYAQLGILLPHYAAAQYGMGVPISRDQLQPGDLVFFRGLGHMGMYIGGGNFIHAPRTGDVVKISSLSDSWYVANWVGARRVA